MCKKVIESQNVKLFCGTSFIFKCNLSSMDIFDREKLLLLFDCYHKETRE